MKHYTQTDATLHPTVKLLLKRGYTDIQVRYYTVKDKVRQEWEIYTHQTGWVQAGGNRGEAIAFIKGLVRIGVKKSK